MFILIDIRWGGGVQTRKVTGYIPIGVRSSGLAMAGDENTLYVADRFAGAIDVVV